MINLSSYSYSLPAELIAQKPIVPRDHSRLMVINRQTQTISHHFFYELPKLLPTNSYLVVNNSKVIPARLFGLREKTGGRVEIFLLKKLADNYSYQTMIRPLGRLKVGEKIVFPQTRLTAQLVDPHNRIVRFNQKNLTPILKKIGHIPLPPYIKRLDEKEDQTNYQTVYARKEGSVAAPTAGLHFTQKLLKEIKRHGHSLSAVTLHVNQGTFKPVVVEDIRQHLMHTESFEMSIKSINEVKAAQQSQKKIVAVGTTSCRVLETVGQQGQWNLKSKALSGQTNIFIYPGFSFKMTNILITNFHLPQSTLLMLVYAFGGSDLMRQAYLEAIKQRYRFYSYGDGMMVM